MLSCDLICTYVLLVYRNKRVGPKIFFNKTKASDLCPLRPHPSVHHCRPRTLHLLKKMDGKYSVVCETFVTKKSSIFVLLQSVTSINETITCFNLALLRILKYVHIKINHTFEVTFFVVFKIVL
jgi:hypothetical protein